jgi:hypothetical protein
MAAESSFETSEALRSQLLQSNRQDYHRSREIIFMYKLGADKIRGSILPFYQL